MFIIFGSPRSGTTLLAATLDLHDAIVVPNETDFIVPIAFVLDRVSNAAVGRPLISQLITGADGFAPSLGQHLSPAAVAEIVAAAPYRLSAILEALYAAVAASAGARLAGDKSPNDLNFARILVKAGLFESEIKVIHIVRDIRDVLLSLRQVGWSPPQTETYFPRFWCSANLYLYDQLRAQTHRYQLVKYEEMLRQPEATFRRLTDLLGLPYQPEMLAADRRGLRYQGLEHHRNLQSPFLTDRIGAWRQTMPDDLRLLCERQAHEALEVFGYDE